MVTDVRLTAAERRKVRTVPPQLLKNSLEMAPLPGILKHAGETLRQPLIVVDPKKLLQYRLRFSNRLRLPERDRALLRETFSLTPHIFAVARRPGLFDRRKIEAVQTQPRGCFPFLYP